MKRHNVKNIIFSSTCATYGHAKTVPLKEDHIQNPVTAYGKSKFMIEQILDDYETAYGFKSIILRYFNAAGADAEAEIGEHHEMETHLIPLAIDTALNQYPSLNIFGSDFATDDGYAVRDYIHVEDLANAHILALLYLLKDQKSQKLNLGSEKGISVLQIIQHVEKLSKTKIKLNLHPKNSFEPSILLADCQIAKKVLQWSPRLSNIKKIIESAWIWHLKKQSLSKRK